MRQSEGDDLQHRRPRRTVTGAQVMESEGTLATARGSGQGPPGRGKMEGEHAEEKNSWPSLPGIFGGESRKPLLSIAKDTVA